MFRRLYDSWILIGSKQYLLIADYEDSTVCAGINKDAIRDADKWFKLVVKLVKKAHKEFMANI